MRNPLGLAIAGALVASGIAFVSLQNTASAGPGDGALTVRLIRDINGNGSYEPALEVGVQGIPVTVTDPAGGTATGTTGADGTVAVNLGSVNGGTYRVEAAIPPSMPYLKPAPAGGGLSSLTEFVSVAGGTNATVTMGVWNPADYCQANPNVATACQRNTLLKADPGSRSVVSFPYDRTGASPAPAVEATQGDTGTVMGLAYSRQRKLIFSGAYAKRLTAYGPGGSGGIYATDPAANTTTLWTTVPNAGGTAHQPNTNQDGVFFKTTGTESLGDLELSEDDSRLFVVNLADRKLYTYDATLRKATAPLSSVAIPAGACVTAADWRPGALGVRDGAVLVGGICSGQSSNKLSDVRAVVYRFDPAAGTFSAPILNKVLDFPRGRVKSGTKEPTFWHPWSDTWKLSQYNAGNDTPRHMEFASPLLTDIEFEANGDLVLGFRDRFSDQVGNNAVAPDGSSQQLFVGVSGGDINRVCRQQDGSFAWEGTAANCPGNQTSANSGNQSTSVVEFYPGEFYADAHHETAQGGLALNYSSPDILTTAMDPAGNIRTDGVLQLNRTKGTDAGGYQITTENSELFAKAHGLADLELLCDLAPVQLGNRVWFDTDADGVQDGGEPALPGVKVTVTPCAGGAPLPVKTTDAKGEYYVGTADGLKPDTCYQVAFDYSGVNTSGLPGAPPVAQLSWTVKEAGPSRSIDSNVDSSGLATVTVGAAGSVDHTIDAGLIAGPTNKLGDFVWADLNRNGVQDSGEPGVDGVKASLRKADGTEVTSKLTAGGGKYLFDNLPDGSYRVCFDLAALPPAYAGYLATKPNAGDDSTDSDADASGCTATTTLGPDKREDLTLDAGIRPPNKLGDFVWIDENRNGVQDGGEPGVAGVTVTVRKGEGTPAGTTTTGSDGKYLFDKLPDDAYTVCFDLSALPAAVAEYQLTKANLGDDAADSDADPASGCTEPVTLGVDSPENLTLDAGLVAPVNRLGDRVWVDLDKNGVQDDGEPGVPGVPVIVRLPDGTEVGSATTDDSGNYLVEGLTDGSYVVCFDTSRLPAAYADFVLTKADAGADDTKDSDAGANGCTPPVELGPGQRENLTLDAGIVNPPNKLGDFVWVDGNANGLQDSGEPGVEGVRVTVKDGNGNEVGTATTDAGGKYLVDNLPDGTFTVCFGMSALPSAYADYQVTMPNAGDDEADSDVYPSSGCTEPVNLGPGNRENLTVDAGITSPANRLGDYVWIDTDADGLQDSGEPGVRGVTVVARKGDAEVARTTTDESGQYLFDNLPDGSYRVCFDLKALPATVADYPLTKANAGGDDGIDSDADPASGCTPEATLGVGKRVNLTLDAGLVAPANRLGDYVWVDATRDGVQDADEPGVEGVTVVLRSESGAEVARTTTDESGKYLFDNLPDGSYRVCFELASVPADYKGYLLTTPNAGSDGADSDAGPDGCTEPVKLGVGHREDLTLDAGIRPPNKLGDLVWLDQNRNGVQDSGEPGVPGVTATLKTPDGKEVGTTKTGEDGKYLFDKLPDGDYLVCFDRGTLPAALADHQLTRPGAGASEVDSDADPSTWCTPAVTLSAKHPEDLTVDAGIVAPRNRIGDYAWIDRDRDGLQDAGEPPAPGVPVTLRDGGGKEIASTTTDQHGRYLFDDLPDGTYQVCFRGTLPAALNGYSLTRAKAGDDTIDSDADPSTGCTRQVTVGGSQREILTLDAGLLAPVATPAVTSTWLSSTGANLGWLIILALVAIGAGTVIVLVTRRRRKA